MEQCLNSIVSQTYKHLQIVLINDGSTDNSEKICKRFVDLFPNVEYYYQYNVGVSETRNRLLAKIKGEYFLFVDADDWIERNMIEFLVEKILHYSAEIAVCDKVNAESDNSFEYKEAELAQEAALEKFLFHKELTGALWNKLIKTDLLQGNHFETGISYGEDALFCWHILQRTNKVIQTSMQLYFYRSNSDSLSHRMFDSKKLSGQYVWEYIYSDVKKSFPQFESLTRANCAVSHFWLLVFASCDNYPKDESIKKFQTNLRKSICNIIKFKLLNTKSLICAMGFVVSYSIMRPLMYKFMHTWAR